MSMPNRQMGSQTRRSGTKGQSGRHHSELALANLLLIHGAKTPLHGSHSLVLDSEKILANKMFRHAPTQSYTAPIKP